MIRRLVRDVVRVRQQLHRVSREELHLSRTDGNKAKKSSIMHKTSTKRKNLQAFKSKLLFRKIPIAIARVERKLLPLRPKVDEALKALEVNEDGGRKLDTSVVSNTASSPAPSPRQQGHDVAHLPLIKAAAGEDRSTSPQSPLSAEDALQLISSLYIFEEHRNRFLRSAIREAERRIQASEKEMKLRTSFLLRQNSSSKPHSLKSSLAVDEHYSWHRDRRNASTDEIRALRASIIARPYLSAKMWRSLVQSDIMRQWVSDGAVSFAFSVTKILPRLCLMLLRQTLSTNGGVVNQSSPRFVVSLRRAVKKKDDSAQMDRKNEQATEGNRVISVKLLPRPAKGIHSLVIGTLDTFSQVLLPFLVSIDNRFLASESDSAAVLEGFVALQQVATALILLVHEPAEKQKLRETLGTLDKLLFEASSAVATALISYGSRLAPADAARAISALNSLTIFESSGAPSLNLLDQLVIQLFPALSNNTLATLMAKARSTSLHSFLSRGHRSKIHRAQMSSFGAPYELSPVVHARIAQRKLKAALREGRLQQVLDKTLTDLADTSTLSQMRSVFMAVAKSAPSLSREASQRAVIACGWVGEILTLQLAETKRSLVEGISLADATTLLLMCTSLMPLERQLSVKNGGGGSSSSSSPAHHKQLRGFAEVMCSAITEHLSARLAAVTATLSKGKGNRPLQNLAGKGIDANGEKVDCDDEEEDGLDDFDAEDGEDGASSGNMGECSAPSLVELSYICSAVSEISLSKSSSGQVEESTRGIVHLVKQLLLVDEAIWKQIPSRSARSQKQHDLIASISDMFAHLGMLDSALSSILFGDFNRNLIASR